MKDGALEQVQADRFIARAVDLERDQPLPQAREELFPDPPLTLNVPDDFDAEDPEINAMFEGKYEKGD